MHYDRIPGGALLGGKDASNRFMVEGICAEAVDRFSGQSDETARGEDAGGSVQSVECGWGLEVVRIDGQPQRLHSAYCLLLTGLAASGHSPPRISPGRLPLRGRPGALRWKGCGQRQRPRCIPVSNEGFKPN
jgi:hypothetical protein